MAGLGPLGCPIPFAPEQGFPHIAQMPFDMESVDNADGIRKELLRRIPDPVRPVSDHDTSFGPINILGMAPSSEALKTGKSVKTDFLTNLTCTPHWARIGLEVAKFLHKIYDY